MADRAVRHVRMRHDDPLRGGAAVGLRQRQAVSDVLPDRVQEMSASVPSKNTTSIVSRACTDATSRRCIPSITGMVRLSTKIGGSGVSVSVRRAPCAFSSSFSRGESAGRSASTGTDTTAVLSLNPPALAARRARPPGRRLRDERGGEGRLPGRRHGRGRRLDRRHGAAAARGHGRAVRRGPCSVHARLGSAGARSRVRYPAAVVRFCCITQFNV